MQEKEGPKQSEQAAAAVVETKTSVPGKSNRVMKMIREMWPAYLIEILVIILGISITLGLEAWRDGIKEKRQEKIYLRNLQADLQEDMNSLRRADSGTQDLLQHGNKILSMIHGEAPVQINSSKLNEDIRSLLSRPKFLTHDATFSELKSSGNLHLIEDPELKNLLFAYYSETQIIKEAQDAEQQATITLSGPYFLKTFALDEKAAGNEALSANIESIAKDLEFQNNVLLRLSNRKELQDLYHSAEATAKKLLAALAE
jgi:hypothetical protein